MADEDLSLEKGGSKKKMMILIIAAVLLLGGGGGGAYFFLFSGSDDASSEDVEYSEEVEEVNTDLEAIYVAMPRPFVFNIMDGKRTRLVQIKIQLLVRGSDNEALAKKHIPLLEGTLVRIFGGATVDQLRHPQGKDQLRADALDAINESTEKLEGKALIELVLFTGFVLQ